MKKRITVVILYAMLLALGFPAMAQQSQKVPRIGYLGYLGLSGNSDNPGPQVKAFRRGLRDLGYTEGKNILIEYRSATVDRISGHVGELMQLKVDVLVAANFPAILAAKQAAKQATKTMPIVMVATVDPVATGLVDNLARPGGNITGLTLLTRDLSGKRLELLKEVVPRISRVGVLRNAEVPGSAIALKEYEAAASALKVQVQSLEVRGPEPNFDAAFESAAKGRVNALITVRVPC